MQPTKHYENDMNRDIKRTLKALIDREIIPATGLFDITETMLHSYVATYGSLCSGNQKFVKSYARKLAGLNLLKLKFSRGGLSTTCKEGLVYLIANPAWIDHLKIGMTIDLPSRLSSYQTYDPLKQFYVKGYEFCLNRRHTEETVLTTFGVHLESGEWVRYTDSKKIIQCIRSGVYIMGL